MELVRQLYEKMRLVQRLWRFAAIVLLVAAIGLAGRLVAAGRRAESHRREAAAVFYQMRELDLEVARLRASSGMRQDFLQRRAGLQAIYDEWLDRLGETSRGAPDERAIRAAVARLGEARVLATDAFIRDVRARVGEWRRTPTFATVMRAAVTHEYPARIVAVLDSAALPADLVWVAFQESRFDPRAVGPATRFGHAKGMWQLMPATARQYGLRTGPLVGQDGYDPADERHDFERSTRAAVRYMTDLYLADAQGSGLLVMAGYNAGQTRVLALLRSLPPTPRDRNFWRLLERHRASIPDETYNYVVGIVAAAAVAAEPAAFGVDPSVIPRI